jgi:Raf kinase inhibitor-like YbhB/YbcL family protein
MAILSFSPGCAKVADPSAEPSVPASVTGDKPSMTIALQSTAFAEGKPIPKKYTGDGDDMSPPLSWSNLPEGTKELALVCDDPDAPTREPWVHWVLYKLSPDLTGLSAGLPGDRQLKEPAGALQGQNTSNATGYVGPAPPRGHGVHHYHFRIYALDAPLSVEPGLTKTALLAAMAGHILGQGELIGTYSR